MHTETRTHIVGDEGAAAYAVGQLTPSSRRPAGEAGKPVILLFRPRSAAAFAGNVEDASSLDEGVASLGELAVFLVAEWSRPRCSMGAGVAGRTTTTGSD